MSQKFFWVDLTYVRPLEEVDILVEAHVEFLKDQYAKGYFIFSRPKEPREGGVILARMDNCEMLDAVLEKDPFNKAGLAHYSVTEFFPRMCAAGFQPFVETP